MSFFRPKLKPRPKATLIFHLILNRSNPNDLVQGPTQVLRPRAFPYLLPPYQLSREGAFHAFPQLEFILKSSTEFLPSDFILSSSYSESRFPLCVLNRYRLVKNSSFVLSLEFGMLPSDGGGSKVLVAELDFNWELFDVLVLCECGAASPGFEIGLCEVDWECR
ncbi:hypothetical protein Droror1_Dr00028197 [Drosera rotundifolia]